MTTAAPRTTTAPKAKPAPKTTTAPKTTSAPKSISVHYQNCDDVRAHGVAPIYPGDPGWQAKFDRDQDGVGCE